MLILAGNMIVNKCLCKAYTQQNWTEADDEICKAYTQQNWTEADDEIYL